MARAQTYTWLPLDEFARLMGYDPWHFNGIRHDTCLHQESCTGVWYQHIHQSFRLSREQLADHIRTAELMLTEFVGYNLLPDWDEETVTPPRYRTPELRSNVATGNRPKSVKLSKGYLLSSGTQTKALIEAGLAITRVDNDGDGFDETAQITVTSADAGPNEIRLYYPDENGDPAWEIRPLKVTNTASPFVVEVPVYMLVKKVYIESLCADDVLQSTDDAIYLTTVDAYRVYNTASQAELVYEPASTCSDDNYTLQYANSNVYVDDEKNGYVVYNPGYLNEPDKVKLNYYSGWMDRTRPRPLVEMDPYWTHAVATLAVGLVDRKMLCCGGDQSQVASHWQDQFDLVSDRHRFVVTTRQIENIFGVSTRGAWFALNRARARKLK